MSPSLSLLFLQLKEDLILAEERTSAKDKKRIMEGK